MTEPQPSKPNECQHKTISYYDHMNGMAEPPYDGTDFTWEWSCEDCDEVFAEGDGYSTPPSRAEVLATLPHPTSPQSSGTPDVQQHPTTNSGLEPEAGIEAHKFFVWRGERTCMHCGRDMTDTVHAKPSRDNTEPIEAADDVSAPMSDWKLDGLGCTRANCPNESIGMSIVKLEKLLNQRAIDELEAFEHYMGKRQMAEAGRRFLTSRLRQLREGDK